MERSVAHFAVEEVVVAHGGLLAVQRELARLLAGIVAVQRPVTAVHGALQVIHGRPPPLSASV